MKIISVIENLAIARRSFNILGQNETIFVLHSLLYETLENKRMLNYDKYTSVLSN